MDKQEYINLYRAGIEKMTEDAQKHSWIEGDFIYYREYNGKVYQYAIDKCLKIREIMGEVHDYLYALKIGDKIACDRFSDDKVVIEKISYRKELSKKGNKIISSFTVKTDWGSLHKTTPPEVIVDGVIVDDLIETYKHFSARGYKFFNDYDIKKADKIIGIYKNEGVTI